MGEKLCPECKVDFAVCSVCKQERAGEDVAIFRDEETGGYVAKCNFCIVREAKNKFGKKNEDNNPVV